MHDNKIIITSELNEQQKEEVSRIFYQSFPLKFPHLWIYNRTENQAFQFLREALNYKYGIYALLNDKVVGLLGLDLGKGKRFAEFSHSAFTSIFGSIGGFMRYIKYSFEENFAHTKANANQSRINPIAVSSDVRGKGVGSILLGAFEQYSKELGNNAIVLEVVDSNPRAKKLYEKEGYVSCKYLWTALFTKKAGFNGLYYMKKNLE